MREFEYSGCVSVLWASSPRAVSTGAYAKGLKTFSSLPRSLSAGMTSVAPSSAQLAEFCHLSRCNIRSAHAHNGSRRDARVATQPRKSRAFQKRGLSLSAAKLKEKDEVIEKSIYDEGVFDTDFQCKVPEEEKVEEIQEKGGAVDGNGGLVPEDWKYMQQDLHLTKLEKKKQFKLQQMENAQLKELRSQLQRQKISLLPSTEQIATGPSWTTDRPQLLDRMQLSELESQFKLKALGKRTLVSFWCRRKTKNLMNFLHSRKSMI